MSSEEVPNEQSEERIQQIEELRRLVWGRDYKKLPFPVKLHMLLSFNAGFASDLWWTNEGKSFAVDRAGFKRCIMSIFFDEHKFRSFQTLLHKYGFHHVTSVYMVDNNVIDVLIYQHELFVEDDIELCRHITRTPSRRNSLKQDIQQAMNQEAPSTLAGSFEEKMPPRRISSDESIEAAVSAVNDELFQLADELADVDDFDYEMCDWPADGEDEGRLELFGGG